MQSDIMYIPLLRIEVLSTTTLISLVLEDSTVTTMHLYRLFFPSHWLV